nr:3'-5' exonuclease [Sphingomonas melonis]
MRPSRPEDVVGVPVPVGTLARALARHPDFRILKRIGPMERRESGYARTGELSVCVLDVETMGFDHRLDEIIELSLQTVRIDAEGRIVSTGRNSSWLEDPGRPIPPEIVKVTGITDADVAGRSISEGEAYGELTSADLLLSHNAAFDRPFVDRRFDLPPRPWICSLNDFAWRDHGFDGRSLTQLLLQCGWFFDAHRAAGDVNALLHLLDHRLEGGATVMKELLVNAARATSVVEAVGAPMSAKDALKSRGYRWDAGRRLWWRAVPEDQGAAERDWVADHAYGGARAPVVRRVTWKERYAAPE